MSAAPKKTLRIVNLIWLGPAIAWLVIFAFFAIVGGENGFLTSSGTAGWLNIAAELGIIAIPVGLLMMSGEFDLSTGSMVGAASIIVAVGKSYYGISSEAAIALALVLAILVGTFNATLVERTKLPSFIVTLASNMVLMGTALGLSRLLAGTSTISMKDDGWAKDAFATKFGDFNISIGWWIFAAVLAAWVLRRTPFGNWVLATGGNLDGARRAGVPVGRVKLVLFIWTAVSSAFVGVMTTFEFNQGNATTGQGYVFQGAIAAVIGGVLITGGFGSVLGIVFGTMIYGVVSLGLFYTGWSTDWLSTFVGALLVIAVITNNVVRQKALTQGANRK
ncbi:ABC transporter permease [Rhizobium sp. C4]|uniref:ABC transporter permease n=1 Tax=Rhizobium sp. C4 TaxID=1349800 RepID=UPI001E32D93D|nr:ABC transporter permease [Rhizobium sp. C4]MCD2172316.1 ABC transporter permease [Rhizobium sp. C4]